MPRRGVDEQLIVATATRLADMHGAGGVTMTALAAELGVRTPSLYAHVASIDAVLAQVQAATMERLGRDLQRAAMGTSGAEGLRAMAHAFRAFARQHPGTYALAMGAPIDRAAVVRSSELAGDALTAMIKSFGVAEVTDQLTFTCVATLHGVLDLDHAGLFRDATDLDVDAAYERAVDTLVAMFDREASLVGASSHPDEHATAAGAERRT